MSWLWDLLENFNLGAILYRLIFPEPVGDATLPPKYIYPPDVLPPPEGGQCPKQYTIFLRRQTNLLGAPPDDESEAGGAIGPLGSPNFAGEITSTNRFRLTVSFSASSFVASDVVMMFGSQPKHFTQSGSAFQIYNPDGSLYGYLNYSVRYQTADGSPDNCGSIPPPVGDRERSIPVSRPVPVPVPLPPVVTPPVPVPIPIPPIPPLPPSLPRPPLPITPPVGINLDVNLNFNFYNDIDFNFVFNINNGTGTLPIEPFQSLAKLLYAILLEVKESRRVIDRMAKQVDCLAEKFCREGKEMCRLPLGIVGYSKRSLYGLPTEDEKLRPIAVQILFAQIQNAAGRRVRPSAPNLYSPQALGYYAFQFESGGFGALEEIRFSQPYISIPERAIAIAFWIEPQAGDGYLYCWYEKTKYETQEEPPSIAP